MKSSTKWRNSKTGNELSLRVDDRGASIFLWLGTDLTTFQYKMGEEDLAKRHAEALVSLGDLKFICNGAEQHYAAAS